MRALLPAPFRKGAGLHAPNALVQGQAASSETFSNGARLIDVEKSFGPLKALDGVSFQVCAGGVHALLGENGAGKSTLMNVLAGVFPPDSGVLELWGEKVRFHGRKDGVRRGIGFVRQHFGLIPELTVAENYLLGHPEAGVFRSVQRAASELAEAGDRCGIPVEPGRRVSQLNVAERQRAEIISALALGARILILDEPTASVGPAEAERVMGLSRQLAERGCGIVYITHRLRETMAIAERITVMRRGRVVGEHLRRDVTLDELGYEMVGALPPSDSALRLDSDAGSAQIGTAETSSRAVIRLHDVSASDEQGNAIHDVNLEVVGGRILGVAGVAGNGQEVLAGLLAGTIKVTGGEATLPGGRVAYAPEDRSRLGLAATLDLVDNLIVYRHKEAEAPRTRLLRARRVSAIAEGLLQFAGITASKSLRAGLLSGGNQQKLVLARELDGSPEAVVIDNPYRGLDLAATARVRQALIQVRDNGAAVVVLSPDLADLLDIADDLAILARGTIMGVVDPGRVSSEEIGRLLGGG